MISSKIKGRAHEQTLINQYKSILTKFIKRLQDPKDLGKREPRYYQDIKNALEKALFYLSNINNSSYVYTKFKLIQNIIEVCGPGVNSRLQDLVYEMQLKSSVYDWLGECRKNIWQQIEDKYIAEHNISAGTAVHVHNHFLLISRKYHLKIPTADTITKTTDEYIHFSGILPEHEESFVFEFKQLYTEETMVQNSVTNFLSMIPESKVLSDEQRDSLQVNIKILTDAHLVSISEILVVDEETSQVSVNPRFIQDLPRYSKALLRSRHIISMYSDAIAFLKEQEKLLTATTTDTSLNQEELNKLSKKLEALHHLLHIRRFNLYEAQLIDIFKNPELLPIKVIREEIDRMLSVSIAVAFSSGEFTCPDLQILEAIYKLDKILLRMGLLLKDSEKGHPDFDKAREQLIEAAVAAYTSPLKTYENNIEPFEKSLKAYEKFVEEALHKAIKAGYAIAKEYIKKESAFILQMSPAEQQQLIVITIDTNYYQLLLDFYELRIGAFSEKNDNIESLSPYYLSKKYREHDEYMTAAVMMMLKIPFPSKKFPLPANLTKTAYDNLKSSAKYFHNRVIENFFWTQNGKQLHEFLMTLGQQVLFYICQQGLANCLDLFCKFNYPNPQLEFPEFSVKKEEKLPRQETKLETKIEIKYETVFKQPSFRYLRLKDALTVLDDCSHEIWKREPVSDDYCDRYNIESYEGETLTEQTENHLKALFSNRKIAYPLIYVQHCRDEFGVSALHIAAQSGHLAIVKRFASVYRTTYTSTTGDFKAREWANPVLHPLIKTYGQPASDIPPETPAAYAKRLGEDTPEVRAVIQLLTNMTGEKLAIEPAATSAATRTLPPPDIKKSVTALIKAKESKEQKESKGKAKPESSDFRMVVKLLENCKPGQLGKLVAKITFSKPFNKLSVEEIARLYEQIKETGADDEDERIQYLNKEISARQKTKTMSTAS